jgi:hypothetical protein
MPYADEERRREYYREYGKTEHRKEWKKNWNETHPERLAQYRKTRLENHRDKINEQKKAAHYRNRESILARRRMRYQERKSEILSENLKWRKENDEKVKQYQSKRRKEMAEEIKGQRRNPNGKYSQYKFTAKTRGHTFILTKEQFMEFWGLPCNYCGESIDGIGLDRIDNSKGYELGNVIPCCRWCNFMKSTYSTKDFLDHCRKVVANNESK